MVVDERSWLSSKAQGYGAIACGLLLVLAVVVTLALQNVIAEAPTVVTVADIEQLQATPALPDSADSLDPVSPPVTLRRGGGSRCERDRTLYGVAQFFHLPKSQLLRAQYSTIVECRLRHRWV